MRFGRTSAPRHPSGCSGCDYIRWDCRCGKSLLCLSSSALIDLMEPSGTGRTISLKPRLTCRRWSSRGSPSTRNRSGVDGEMKWLYAAVDTESKLLLEIDVHSRRGIVPAGAFLHHLTEKHDVSDTEFLVDGGGYLTAIFRHELNGQLNYTERNHIEKWFQTVSMRIDHFHSFWRGSQSSARRWLRRFRHYYNHEQPNQTLNNQTPAEVVLNYSD